MKKVFLCVSLLLCLCCSFLMIACSNTDDSSQESAVSSSSNASDSSFGNSVSESSSVSSGDVSDSPSVFTNVSFSDKTVTYTGEEVSISVSGDLPIGTQVSYTNNTGIDAGTYEATAVLSCEGYVDKELHAKLIIKKAVFSDTIRFSDRTFVQSGKTHTLEISGDLPSGTEVVYANNTASKVGTYYATATLKNPNYEEKVLHATFVIKEVSNMAKEIVSDILNRPRPWTFIPEIFHPENFAYAATSILNTDFTSFVSVNRIGTRFLGKQFSCLYNALLDVEQICESVDTVYLIGESIATVYQKFINNNPNDYTEFTATVEGFSIKITLTDSEYALFAGNKTVNVELYVDKDSDVYKGRIQLTSGAAVKYEMTDTSLQYAYKIGVGETMTTSIFSFARNQEKVVGYMYEFLGVEGTGLTTTVSFSIDDEYTRILAKKRESDDLIVNGAEEVYDSKTGEFLSGLTEEMVKLVDFQTYWFPLYRVSGFQTVKVLDKSNGLNPDSVYINGSSAVLATKNIGGLGLDVFSRRYDVEMKDVSYMKAVENEGKISYESVKTEIPMLFVQTKSYDTFGKDIQSKNTSVFSTEPKVNALCQIEADREYAGIKTVLDALKACTYTDVVTYIGTKNTFFGA